MLYSDYVTCRKDYQEFGSLFLLEKKHACLFYKPGKGKTYPCIDALREIDKTLNGNASVLIMSTPDAIKNMWCAEIVPQNILPKNTKLISFNSAISPKQRPDIVSKRYDVIIIDECHKIKAHNTKSAKLVYQLAKKTPYVWGLSGTPRGNSDVDIFCQFHNMWVGEWGSIAYSHFVDNCCDIQKQFFNGACVKVPTGINHRYKGGWERNIAEYTQRVEYNEEDRMPPIVVNEVMIPFEPTKEYISAEDSILSIGDYETTLTKLTAIQKCHQLANGFVYIPTPDGVETRIVGDNKKSQWLIDNLTGTLDPIVIVYMFQEDYRNIINTLTFCGKRNNYTESVEDFKTGKSTVLLLQCSRCESFNLQMCNRIIFYTMDYSYIKYNQMLHRVYRMGQTKPVQIDVLIAEGTVERQIWRSVQNKERMSDLFMRIKGV